jgi:hypothetical protein
MTHVPFSITPEPQKFGIVAGTIAFAAQSFSVVPQHMALD